MNKKSKYKLIAINCPICGKEFSFKENKKRKYCSVDCKNNAQKGKKPYKIDLDMEEIKRLYVEEKKSTLEIAKLMGTYKKMVRQRLLDIGVTLRSSGESKSLYLKNNPDKNPFKRENVKAKIRPTLSDPKNIAKRQVGIEKFYKNISEERRKLWNENLSKAWAAFSDEKKKLIVQKQYGTKNKNGTTYQSLFEREISEWLSKHIDNIKTNIYIPGSKELDIYLPDYNLAIEFNGIYWHSESRRKDKNYHLNKTLECEKQGIELIHIFEDEWIEKRDIVKSIIGGKLGLNDKIYARKCEIKEIENKEAKSFYERNHIQGSINSRINIGLFYEEELVSCLSFKKSRYNKKYDWEISRFANKLGLSIVGGFAKMLKYFQKNYSGSIITYSDRRWFDGAIYENNKFIKQKPSAPNYYYTDYKFRYSRINFQKHKLEEKLEYFDPQLTEWENMQLNGWDRIWDCGNNIFVLN